jgi:hypothetical protein
MRTALRVLTAAIERRDPRPTDREELRRFAPLLANAALDELARGVIQALKRHSEARALSSRQDRVAMEC